MDKIPLIDWIWEEPGADDDESAPVLFNEDFESDSYEEGDED